MAKLTDCLGFTEPTKHSSLPEHVQKILLSFEEDANPEEIRSVLYSYMHQVDDAKNKLERPTQDPDNELNTFEQTDRKNDLFHQSGSIEAALRHPDAEERFDENQRGVLETLTSSPFMKDFFAAIEAIWNQKNPVKDTPNAYKFRHADMLQFLPRWLKNKPQAYRDGQGENKLSDPVKAVIAMTAYEWLHSDALFSQSMTERDMKFWLNIDNKEEDVPGSASMYLQQLGLHRDMLASQLGRTIRRRLGLKATGKSHHLAQSRLEMSLGYMAIAAMEETGKLERMELFLGKVTEEVKAERKKEGGVYELLDGQFGLAALINRIAGLQHHQVIWDPKKQPKKTGTPTIKFMRLRDPDSLETGHEQMSTARDTFDVLFGSEERSQEVLWDKPKAPEKMPVGNNSEASKEQTKNLRAYMRMPLVLSKKFADVYRKLSDNIQEIIQGKVDDEHLLDLRKDSVAGSNQSLESDRRALNDLFNILDDRERRGLSLQFFTRSKFMNNMRMLMTGRINPQNSKPHRATVSPEAWTVAFDITDETTGLVQEFQAAVATAMGIEQGKMYRGIIPINSVEDQIRELNNLIKEPEVRDALTALRNMAKGQNRTDLREAAIVAGVQKGGEKQLSLKGLFEYARYQNHMRALEAGDKPGAFETDMHNEIDGISNGPVIGMLMFIPKVARNAQTLAAMAMGGMSISNTVQNMSALLTNKFLHDAYQRMADTWSSNIVNLKSIAGPSNLQTFAALEHILGPLSDPDGTVAKTIRNLAKPRTMQTFYSAGAKRQNELFAAQDIVSDRIYGGLEEILRELGTGDLSQNVAQSQMQALLYHAAILTSNNPSRVIKAGQEAFDISGYLTDGEIDVAKVKKFKALEAWQMGNLTKRVGDTYGLALAEAIDEVYGDYIKARMPFNNVIQKAATIYNLTLKRRIDEKLAEKQKGHPGKPKWENRILTEEELNEILEDIKPLIPRIKTPISKDGDESYLALAEVDRRGGPTAQQEVPADGDPSEVRQNYNSMERHRAFVDSIPYLKPVGASAMVRMIQMMDSMVANHVMSLRQKIINAHDGFSHSIADGQSLRESINKFFYDMVSEYSLATQIVAMDKEMLTHLEKEVGALQPGEILSQYLEEGIFTLDDFLGMKGFDGKEIKKQIGNMKDRKGISWAEAVDGYLSKLVKTPKDILDINQYLTDAAVSMAGEVNASKDEFMALVTHSAQYPQNGLGYSPPVNPKRQAEIWGVDTRSVLPMDVQRAQKEAKYRFDDGLNAHPDGNVSNDPADYPNGAKSVDRQNAAQVLDETVAADRASHHSVQDSTEHVSHLRRVLDRIVQVTMPAVEVFRAEHKLDRVTQGEYRNESRRIWIQTQKVSNHPPAGALGYGIRMSSAEVYAHEMVHHITHAGLRLDGHLNQQALELREYVYRALEARYGATAYRVFMNEPNRLGDPALAEDEIAAQARWNYIFKGGAGKDSKGRELGVDEFLALGLTNANFIRELGKLKIDDKTIKARRALKGIFQKNIQTTIINLFERIMSVINQTYRKQEHSTKVNEELENLVYALSQVEGRQKTGIMKYLFEKEALATAKSVVLDSKIKEVVSEQVDRIKRTNRVSQAIRIAREVPELDNMISQQMRNVIAWYNRQEQGIIKSLITEHQGLTDRLQELHAMLSNRKRSLDQAKEEAGGLMRDVVNGFFTRELDEKEKVALTRVALYGDLSSLLNTAGQMGELTKWVGSDVEREAKIKRTLQNLTKLLKAENLSGQQRGEIHNFFRHAADELGYFMVTKDRHADAIPFMNASNIVQMDRLQHAGIFDGSQNRDKIISLVDQLASLSSIRYMSKADKNYVAALMKEQASGVEDLLGQHNLLKEQAFQELFQGSEHLMEKGYTKTIVDQRIQYKQATLADEARLLAMGYHRQKDPIARDPSDPVTEDIYMYRATVGTVNELSTGIASFTRNKVRGVAQYDLLVQTGVSRPGKQAAANTKKVLREVDVILAGMLKTKRPPRRKVPGANYMVPKFNTNGEMTEMRYVMKNSTKESVLQQHLPVDSILGAMSTQIVDKRETPQINNDLLHALRELFDHKDYGFNEVPELFVEISATAANPHHRDIYNRLPPAAKKTIESLWGDNKMYVPRDVIDLAFGQRKASITELFAKTDKDLKLWQSMIVEALSVIFSLDQYAAVDTVDPDDTQEIRDAKRRGKVVTRAKRVEEFLTDLTKLGKSNIIVRNLSVTAGNYASNMALLKSLGLTAEEITDRSREAIISAYEYQTIHSEQQLLKAKRKIIQNKHSWSQAKRDKLVGRYDRAIMMLEHRLANNKSKALIEAGLLPKIVDDVDTATIQSPYKHGLNKGIDVALEKLPDRAEKIARTMFMTEDTEGFKMLNNAVKMTDYVGRYVLYHKLAKDGMSHKDAVAQVMDKFINFDLPTHRWIEYANTIGLLWFSKYQIRVLKQIKELVTDHSFTTLVTFIAGSFVGGHNILQSLPGITKDFFGMWGDPVSAFMDSVGQILYLDISEAAIGTVVD